MHSGLMARMHPTMLGNLAKSALATRSGPDWQAWEMPVGGTINGVISVNPGDREAMNQESRANYL